MPLASGQRSSTSGAELPQVGVGDGVLSKYSRKSFHAKLGAPYVVVVVVVVATTKVGLAGKRLVDHVGVESRGGSRAPASELA